MAGSQAILTLGERPSPVLPSPLPLPGYRKEVEECLPTQPRPGASSRRGPRGPRGPRGQQRHPCGSRLSSHEAECISEPLGSPPAATPERPLRAAPGQRPGRMPALPPPLHQPAPIGAARGPRALRAGGRDTAERLGGPRLRQGHQPPQLQPRAPGRRAPAALPAPEGHGHRQRPWSVKAADGGARLRGGWRS